MLLLRMMGQLEPAGAQGDCFALELLSCFYLLKNGWTLSCLDEISEC